MHKMKKKVLIWGTSDNCIARCIRSIDMNVVDIVGFVDSDSKKNGLFITPGKKYCKSKRKSYDWSLELIPIFSPENIVGVEFDYLLIGTLEFSKEIYEQILNHRIFDILKGKILLVIDELYHQAYFDLEMFDNNLENSILFHKNNFIKVKEFNELIFTGINKKDNLISFKDAKFPYDSFIHENKTAWTEITDILQNYIFDNRDFFSFVEGPYEHENVLLENTDIVIDCGANIGVFSVLGSLKSSNGRVYAFEPIPEVYNMLKKTAALYNNIIPCELALSNTNGNIYMDYDDSKKTCGSISEGPEGNLLVKVETLDHFVEENNLERVDFIKADIEGAERFMLEGAKNILRKYAPKLSICTYHLPGDKEVLERIILEANPDYIIEHHWLKLFAYVPVK